MRAGVLTFHYQRWHFNSPQLGFLGALRFCGKTEGTEKSNRWDVQNRQNGELSNQRIHAPGSVKRSGCGNPKTSESLRSTWQRLSKDVRYAASGVEREAEIWHEFHFMTAPYGATSGKPSFLRQQHSRYIKNIKIIQVSLLSNQSSPFRWPWFTNRSSALHHSDGQSLTG